TINYTDGTSFTTANLTGPQGPQGIQGIQGIQGPQGNGISNTVDNGNGTFTINYTDGTSFTTADLTGPQGPIGPMGPDWNITSLDFTPQGNAVLTTDQPQTFTSPIKAWLLSGNGGTNPPTEFIGTTDAQPWVIKTNDLERARVLATGNVGIGEINPVDRLQISNGNTRIGEVVTTAGGEGFGRLLYFSGGNAFGGFNSDNSDPLYIARYNVNTDVSQLRMVIGDNNNYGSAQSDAFIIGNTQAGGWFPKVTVRSDGKTTITRDGVGELTPNDATLALADDAGTGRRASISFHNLNEAEGTLTLTQQDNTGVGLTAGLTNRRIRLFDNQAQGLGLQISGNLWYGNNNSRTQTRLNAGIQGSTGAQSGFYEFNQPSGNSQD
ncbi:MAG: hypothetical protein MH137_13420, partial [Flavobacteriales bacterium]|nr:hypothetical protein [Flavobacteriales bacterium]